MSLYVRHCSEKLNVVFLFNIHNNPLIPLFRREASLEKLGDYLLVTKPVNLEPLWLLDLRLSVLRTQAFPAGLVKTQLLGPTPDVLMLQVWDGLENLHFCLVRSWCCGCCSEEEHCENYSLWYEIKLWGKFILGACFSLHWNEILKNQSNSDCLL